jgi:membrane-associated phospholipid phosphatase
VLAAHRRRLAVAAAAVVALGLLTADLLYDGALRRADGTVAAWVSAHVGHGWSAVLRPLTFLGQRGFVAVPLVVVTALVVRRTRSLRPLLVVGGALLATALIVGTMKIGFGRTAPGYGDDLLGQGGLSYPSGHAVNAVLVWTLVVRMLAGVYGNGRLRVLRLPAAQAGVVAAVVLVNAVGMLGLNYHWATDVAAGWLIGLALVVLTPSPVPPRYAGGVPRAAAVRSRREPDRPVPSG